MREYYRVYPVGIIRKDDTAIQIQVWEEYVHALQGIEDFSHLMVFYWFHQNDVPDKRKVLELHPRGDPQLPLTGVFGTHAPIRPNPIAVTVCRRLSRENDRVYIDDIDALDESPVIDIKPYVPPAHIKSTDITIASWVYNK
jgi:tRNA-Thr(GGU) m(6)t(6)A37 methyltransferase TsaA